MLSSPDSGLELGSGFGFGLELRSGFGFGFGLALGLGFRLELGLELGVSYVCALATRMNWDYVGVSAIGDTASNYQLTKGIQACAIR